MKSFGRTLALLVSVAMLLAACGGGEKSGKQPAAGAPAPNQAAAPVEAAKPKEVMKVSIAVGGKGSIIYLPPAIAEYKGYFKDEAVEITVSDVKGGAQAIQALIAGETDMASAAVEHAIRSQAQGVDLVMLALYTRYPAITLIADSNLKDQIKGVEDLKGKKVGVTSTGSATHKALLSLLAQKGLKASDVEVVGVGTSGMPEAIKSGKVHAAFGLDPWVTEMVASNKAFILTDLRITKDTHALYGGDYPLVGLVTRREVIQKNPELVERVVRALVKANKYIVTAMPEEIAAALPADLKGVAEPLYVASLKANIEAFSPDAIASEQALQRVIDSLKADKAIPEGMDIKPATVFDASYARKAG